MSTFATANSRRADFTRGRSGCKEGALHIVKCLLTLCHLVSLNLGNSITQIKDIAEVDTTGRYTYALPVVCRRLTLPSMHTFWEQKIYQRRGCQSLFVICEVFLGPNETTSRGEMPRFLYVVTKTTNKSDVWVFDGHETRKLG